MLSIESNKVKMYWNVCNRYREFKKSKISYIFKKKLQSGI